MMMKYYSIKLVLRCYKYENSSKFSISIEITMAQLFNRIGQLGLGLALAGGVVNSALYNGLFLHLYWKAFNHKTKNRNVI